MTRVKSSLLAGSFDVTVDTSTDPEDQTTADSRWSSPNLWSDDEEDTDMDPLW